MTAPRRSFDRLRRLFDLPPSEVRRIIKRYGLQHDAQGDYSLAEFKAAMDADGAKKKLALYGKHLGEE